MSSADDLKRVQAEAVLFERRVLTFVTFGAFVGVIVLFAAISTDYWVILVGGTNGMFIENTNTTFLWSYSGKVYQFHTKKSIKTRLQMSTLNNVERDLASVLLSLFSRGNGFFKKIFSNFFRKLQNHISKTPFNFPKLSKDVLTS